MFFDGRSHRFLTKLMAYIAIIAICGFGLVAGGLAVSGGCGAMDPQVQALRAAEDSQAAAKARLAQAQAAAKATPKDRALREQVARTRDELARATSGVATALGAIDPKDPAALSTAQEAARLAPGNLDVVVALASVATLQGNPSAALPAYQAYTARNPRDAQAFLYYGQAAQQASQAQQAILAYQRFLQLSPKDPLASDVRSRLSELTAPAN